MFSSYSSLDLLVFISLILLLSLVSISFSSSSSYSSFSHSFFPSCAIASFCYYWHGRVCCCCCSSFQMTIFGTDICPLSLVCSVHWMLTVEEQLSPVHRVSKEDLASENNLAFEGRSGQMLLFLFQENHAIHHKVKYFQNQNEYCYTIQNELCQVKTSYICLNYFKVMTFIFRFNYDTCQYCQNIMNQPIRQPKGGAPYLICQRD